MSVAYPLSGPTPTEKIKFLLVDDIARRLFQRIFQSRRLRFTEIRASEPDVEPEVLKEHLKRLVAEELVASSEAVPVEELQTYYVTPTGLTTERRLREIKAG